MLVHDRATPLARRRTPEGFLEMRAREVTVLKARAIADAAKPRTSVASLRRTLEIARGTCGPGFDAPELGIDGIRRAAVAAVLGPEAVRGRADAFVMAAFDTLAGQPFAGRSDPGLSLIALRVRNAALSNAWKPGATEIGSTISTSTTSWLDADPVGYLTQPRDGDGRWTTGAESSAAAGSGVGAFSSAGLSSVGRPDCGGSVPEHSSNLKQTAAVLPVIAGLGSSIAAGFAGRLQIAYPDGWQACHEQCLQETDHIRGPDRPSIYRKCVRKCLGPEADY